MNDFLHRGIIDELNVRFTYALTTNLTTQAILKHKCDPVSGHILGRSLTSATLLSPFLNKKERLTIQWNYPEGLIRKITVDTGNEANTRGFTNKKAIMDKADDLLAIYGKQGTINVIKSSDKKVLQNSSSEALLHDPVKDLAFYYSISEQLETEIQAVVGFLPNPLAPVSTSQGFLIQALPNCDLNVFDKLRKRMDSLSFRELLKTPPTCDNYFEKLINILIKDMGKIKYSINDCSTPLFKCYCSRERMIQVAKTLTKENLTDYIMKHKPLKIFCNFCAANYLIPYEVINQIIKKKEEK